MTQGPRPARSASRFPPAFVREVESPAFRPKLLAGVVTGYSTAVALLLITLASDHFGVLLNAHWAYALILVKIATNTLAWMAWRYRRLVLPLSTLNIIADVFLLTGTVYYTGGVLSPLVAVYFIEVAVMALLTNVGLTVTVLVGCFVFYSAMAILTQVGILPAVEPLATTVVGMPNAALGVLLAIFAFSTLVPGLYVAFIVEQLRRSEERLSARAAELVEANRAKSEFTANITHELRTPLHGILGMGEILEEGVYGPLTPAQHEAVETMRRSARGLLEMIDSLLVLARAEALKLEVQRAPVDVAEVVSSVIATGRMVVGTRPLELLSEIATDLPPVQTDRQKLVQILVNLVGNAIKFTPDDGAVRIAARAEGQGVLVEVSDTGTGIAPEALAKIFEPYVQADGSPVREHGGAGIGLSVVRTLSDLLGIELSVESEVGKGSTFRLRLPASAA